MKYTLALLLALCLVGAAHAHTLNVNQLFVFPCQPALSSFCPDGAQPVALIQASDGNFYPDSANLYDSLGDAFWPMAGKFGSAKRKACARALVEEHWRGGSRTKCDSGKREQKVKQLTPAN